MSSAGNTGTEIFQAVGMDQRRYLGRNDRPVSLFRQLFEEYEPFLPEPQRKWWGEEDNMESFPDYS